MSRRFRLAAVERMRGRRLEDAGRALAEARQAMLEARTRRELLAVRLAGCQPARRAPAVEVSTAARRREQLRERIVAADGEIAELTARAELARGSWVVARGDLRAVEALHERYREAVRYEQDRREQRLVDDLAALRHRGPAAPSPSPEPARGSGGVPA
jgi:flagellar export protein FliJ